MTEKNPSDCLDLGTRQPEGVVQTEDGVHNVVASMANSKVPGVCPSLKYMKKIICDRKCPGLSLDVGRYDRSNPLREKDITVPGGDPLESPNRIPDELVIPFGNMDNDFLGICSGHIQPYDVNGGWPRVEDKSCVDESLACQIDPIVSLSPRDEVLSNSLGRGTGRKHNQSKSSRVGDGNWLYERQWRYRERKKNKAKEVEGRLSECLAQVESLKQENKKIRHKIESLLMIGSYWDESIRQARPGLPSDRDAENHCEESNTDGQKIKIKEEIRAFGLDGMLERILEPFLSMMKEPESYVVQKLASYVMSKWDKETRKHCQTRIQNKLSTYLRGYYDAASNEAKEEYTRKMDILIQTRRRLADYMVKLHPDFVMERVLEGWVEKGFDKNLVGEDSIEIDQSCISLLVSNLGLSQYQLEEACMAWGQFLSNWNQKVDKYNSLLKIIKKDINWSNIYERGMRTGTQASLELRTATVKLREINMEKARMILNLSNFLHRLLSPVQLARLGTFYPAYTPNWVCVAKLLSHECGQDSLA